MRSVKLNDDAGHRTTLARPGDLPTAAHPEVHIAIGDAYRNNPLGVESLFVAALPALFVCALVAFVDFTTPLPIGVYFIAAGGTIAMYLLVAWIVFPFRESRRFDAHRNWIVRTCVNHGYCPSCAYVVPNANQPTLHRCSECGATWNLNLPTPEPPNDHDPMTSPMALGIRTDK